MEELLRQLAAFGPGGVIAAIALYAAWKKDQQIKELHETHAKEIKELHATLVDQTIAIVDRYHGAVTEMNATVGALIGYEDG